MRRATLAFTLVVSLSAPAAAVVGGAPEVPDPTSQPEVMIVGSGGTFCSGVAIAPDLVLTAAHCIAANTTYKLVEGGPDRKPVFKDVAKAARHPQFSLKTMLAHRATADVALLKLVRPLTVRPAPLMPARARVAPGETFILRGYGASVDGNGDSAGRLREAALVATGQPGNLQLRLIDPKAPASKGGLGACTGDSGAPVYQETPSGLAIYGVMSWATAPGGESGCGGLTGVTPLELYRPWIKDQAKKMGSGIGP